MSEPDQRCRHCGYPIVWVNFAWMPKWMHQPPGAAFQDGQHEYCRLTVAEPETA